MTLHMLWFNVKVIFVYISSLVSSIFTPVSHNECMIAHRGYSGVYPENTELAFEMAGKSGFGGAETDIHRTKDGVYVTYHDDTIIFDDGSEMTIVDHTFDELTQKPIMNETTEDKVYLCTLEKYFSIMKSYDMICFVELKASLDDNQIKEVFALADKTYSIDKVILQSFDFDMLVRIRNLVEDLPIMLTFGTGDTGYERCFEYNFSIDSNINMVTNEMVEAFHSRGLQVAAYTANTKSVLVYAQSFGLDYIETDYFSCK